MPKALLLGGPSDTNGTYAEKSEGLALGYVLPDVLTQTAWGDEQVLVWPSYTQPA